MTRRKNTEGVTNKKKRTKKTHEEDEIEQSPAPAPVGRPLKRGWPVEVPILAPADVCWNGRTQDGRYDLAEWLTLTFHSSEQGEAPKCYQRAYRVLLRVLRKRFACKGNCLFAVLEFAHTRRKPNLTAQARAWNLMLQQLGYSIDDEGTDDGEDGEDEES